MLKSRGLDVALHAEARALPTSYFDRVICTEVIEHASSPRALIEEVWRVLRPGGRAVFTTPIRITEVPEDPNHVREWFPSEFVELFTGSPMRMIEYLQMVPVAAPEVYFWRPPVFGRVPVFRLLCNALSICAGVNATSWLRMRPRMFMVQIAVVERPR